MAKAAQTNDDGFLCCDVKVSPVSSFVTLSFVDLTVISHHSLLRTCCWDQINRAHWKVV
jgi:hypothetical protein